ncbi:ABC transporter permease subunit [Bacillus haynesii]|uniref:ABC transporter permease subunit n=1 Tax=Bacillus haynesii TaxID=1925021 RepID=UPI001C2369D3|nr:ABC transporter permease subunit [Bacillus haynesii]MBU8685051.1 ABC transporter permease subunit [Bacillus haynesii]MCY8435856.1 ABC transporter permease subunit [Bacillus haynesii]MCY9156969.1 ABC transporter permease subunit [Bacillus haynesii]MCY9452732.1 ABC transporter permease subunit [Bacillus haynesii]
MNPFKIETNQLKNSVLVRICIALLMCCFIWGLLTLYQSAEGEEHRQEKIQQSVVDEVIKNGAEEELENGGLEIEKNDDIARSMYIGLHPSVTPNLFLLILANIGPIVFIIIGSHLIGSEYHQGTVKMKAAHIGWRKAVSGKLCALLSLVLVMVTAALLLGLAGGWLAWKFATAHSDLAASLEVKADVSYPVLILFLMIGLTFYSVLGMTVTLLTKSRLAGVLISLAIPYAEQMMSLPFLPLTAYQSLMVHHFIYVDGSIIGQPYLTEPMGEPSAWAVLVCWLFAFIAVQQFAAKKQQIL